MNQLKPGDLVRFADDVGEGRVIRILGDGMVEVRTADGWDIPAYANRLVIIPEQAPDQPRPPVKPGSALKEAVPEPVQAEQPIKRSEGGSGIFLAAIRLMENGNWTGIRFCLINDCACRLVAAFYQFEEGRSRLVCEENLEEEMMIDLAEFGLEHLATTDSFAFQGIIIEDSGGSLKPVIDFILPFTARKFSSPGAYGDTPFLDEPAWLIRLDEPVLKKEVDALSVEAMMSITREKELENIRLNKPREFKKSNPDRIPVEVDLHINKLVDQVIGLDNQEILAIQMKKFREELDSAIIDNEREIIFIHGIGNGTLKNELRNTVTEEYPFCYFEDASYREYGFGATRVFIRQNKQE